MLRINNFNPIPFPAGVLKNQDTRGRGEWAYKMPFFAEK